jgi:hypothetical protein
MKIRESIIVMNNKTWELFRDNALDTASLQDDPIEYLAKFNGLDVVIDEAVQDGITEVWYRDVYEFNKELERIKAEQAKEKGDK